MGFTHWPAENLRSLATGVCVGTIARNSESSISLRDGFVSPVMRADDVERSSPIQCKMADYGNKLGSADSISHLKNNMMNHLEIEDKQ